MTVIRDPLYRVVEVEDEFIKLIDNPYFQRLRFIKQNANLFYVYPSAKHDRFAHCIGSYHLMKKIVENKLIKLSEQDKFNLKAAALLHDIGHGPYSHMWELVAPDYDHEKIGTQIIEEIYKLPEVAKIIQKKHPLYPLLSSVLDVDKMDYMARDSYFCGVGYGDTDVDRIVNHMAVKDKKICILPKIVPSVEHVIIGRITLYKSLYYHKASVAKDVLFRSIFMRVKDLMKENKDVFLDSALRKFLDDKFELKDVLSFDDSTIEFHFSKWKNSKDLILKDLVNKFLSRKGFSAIETRLIKGDKDAIKKDVARLYPLKYYYYKESRTKTIYESEVLVMLHNKFVPLSKYSSQIMSAQKADLKLDFIIGPKEVLKKYK